MMKHSDAEYDEYIGNCLDKIESEEPDYKNFTVLLSRLKTSYQQENPNQSKYLLVTTEELVELIVLLVYTDVSERSLIEHSHQINISYLNGIYYMVLAIFGDSLGLEILYGLVGAFLCFKGGSRMSPVDYMTFLTSANDGEIPTISFIKERIRMMYFVDMARDKVNLQEFTSFIKEFSCLPDCFMDADSPPIAISIRTKTSHISHASHTSRTIPLKSSILTTAVRDNFKVLKGSIQYIQRLDKYKEDKLRLADVTLKESMATLRSIFFEKRSYSIGSIISFLEFKSYMCMFADIFHPLHSERTDKFLNTGLTRAQVKILYEELRISLLLGFHHIKLSIVDDD